MKMNDHKDGNEIEEKIKEKVKRKIEVQKKIYLLEKNLEKLLREKQKINIFLTQKCVHVWCRGYYSTFDSSRYYCKVCGVER